jgi:hypothetical protein
MSGFFMTTRILQLMVLCEPIIAACVSFVALEDVVYFERPSRKDYRLSPSSASTPICSDVPTHASVPVPLLYI